jgi:CheY-like chemotaxis protein
MSKIEAGKLELNMEPFSFAKMIELMSTVFRFRTDEKHQNFDIRVDPEIPQALIGDEQRLSQVITNLIGNAAKFTPEGGSVSFDANFVSEDEDGLCLIQAKVSDNGIGMTSEQQSRLFNAFTQAENSTSRRFGGTGRGLAISRHLVEMMGGKIWVESALGEGSSFYFTFKAKRAPKGSLADDSYEAGNTEANSADDFSKFHLLLADDVDVNREIVIALLEDTGISIDSAVNGAEALGMYRKKPDYYDIIFMDVQMPHMDGYEATRQIRKFEAENPGLRNVPIIAMTANVFRSDIEMCAAAGMNDHLGKPIEVKLMREKLRKYL